MTNAEMKHRIVMLSVWCAGLLAIGCAFDGVIFCGVSVLYAAQLHMTAALVHLGFGILFWCAARYLYNVAQELLAQERGNGIGSKGPRTEEG